MTFVAVSSSTTVKTVPKPTGVQVGDLLLAFGGNDQGGNLITPTGFTIIGYDESHGGSGIYTRLSRRVADSSDLSVTDYTLMNNNRYAACCTMLAFRDVSYEGYVFGWNNAVTALTTGSGVTPADATAKTLVIFGGGVGGATCQRSAYNVVTDDPSWNEAVDQARGAWDDCVFAAYSTSNRANASSTGAFRATASVGIYCALYGVVLDGGPVPESGAQYMSLRRGMW